MDLTCGFFNSIEGDERRYNADDMSRPYQRIISNGVFSDPNGREPSDFKVSVADNDLDVLVQAGEGMFAYKWTELETSVELPALSDHPASNINDRIDSVIVRIDNSPSVRKGMLLYVVGQPSSEPQHPAITRSANINEYRIADIYVHANAQTLTSADITDKRSSADCGYATHLLSSRALIKSYKSLYTTTVQDETSIPINISQYAKEIDILQVYINGLMLVEGSTNEYTINTAGDRITLKKPVDAGTPIHFVVYKSIDSTDAESILGDVEMLRRFLPTSETGSTRIRVEVGENVLDKFKDLSIGLYTIYCASGSLGVPKTGAYRMLGHLTTGTTGSEVGWLLAFQTDGSVYSNYLNGGSWRGWAVLYEKSPAMLWEGSLYMNATANVTPSKTLSECQHGWVLVWSDYDPDTETKNQYNVVTCCVPKKNAVGNNWNGSSFMCSLPLKCNEDGTYEFTCKQVYIYNDHITGYAGNNQGVLNKGVVLSCIYEY